MKQATKTVRIPINIGEVIYSFAEYKKWSKTTALSEIIKSSPIYLDYLSTLEKNKETA